eukprot:s478_g6.t1
MSSSSISWCSWNKKLWQQQQLDRALIQEIGPCCISVSLLWQNIAGALRIIMAKTQLSNPRPLTFTPEPLTLTDIHHGREPCVRQLPVLHQPQILRDVVLHRDDRNLRGQASPVGYLCEPLRPRTGRFSEAARGLRDQAPLAWA